MVVPNATELLFSIIFSYMGAIEFFFIVRNLYHWGFKHHKRLIQLADNDDSNSLNDLQEKVKAAIDEAKEKEVYGLSAMKDGVLYKNGFRVSPDDEILKNERHVIGSSRNSVEKQKDSSVSEKIDDSKKLTESRIENDNNEKISYQSKEQIQEVIEESYTKKHVNENLESSNKKTDNNSAADDGERTKLTQNIKTQYGQTDIEHYSSKSRAPEINIINNETQPNNQQSSEFGTVTVTSMRFNEYERPEPDGQDVNESQYSDEYLRSLDGIKYRPLVRDDGTGRRRAFKKRRSSGDSTSSRESRASREEELKMFTSLEEEEFEAIRRGETEYTPIRYSSDPNLKVKHSNRRQRKSPIKYSKDSEESRSSLEMLDEEKNDPWGDVKPEHYKDMEFWKREKTISIEEENEENNTENQQKALLVPLPEEATQKCASPSPIRNIPKMSSFGTATQLQNEDAISSFIKNRSHELNTINQKQNEKGSTDTKENVSINASDSASSPTPFYHPNAFTYSNVNEKSFETDANVLHDQKTDELIERLSIQIRKSPRQDDMQHFEENFIEEEKKDSRTPSPQHNLATDQNGESIQHDDNYSTFTSNKPPIIEIGYAAKIENTESQLNNEDQSLNENELESDILLDEGISDFYDFNVSAIRSRTRSRSRSQSRPRCSKSPLKFHKAEIKESSPIIREKSVSPTIVISTKDTTGISDWYDYNVMLNERAYGTKNLNRQEISHTSTEYILSQLPKNEERWSPKGVEGRKAVSKEKSNFSPEIKINNKKSEIIIPIHDLKEDCENKRSPKESSYSERSDLVHKARSEQGSPKTLFTPIKEPPTPQYPRSFSAEWKDTERLKEEFKQQFKRSTYVGESSDFSDQFEELREQTRHFKRSRSKSRTPNDQDVENVQIGSLTTRRKLQEKILAQITKTTLDYQDFAKDINNEFLDHERRGSDSALIQKSKILIQLQDSQSQNGEFDDTNLEGEEYHHFRRFSLNQEAQTEQYPEDEYIYEYVKEIDISKISPDKVVDELLENPDDSGSDDERQTVVEVEDEIDEDIWDYEKSDEFNEHSEQSECEEAEREADRYLNRSAHDWKEEGAVGGDIEWKIKLDNENVTNIDDIYDEAIKYAAEGKIERDYENIIEAMNNEDHMKIESFTESNDNISVKTDDLLDEILKDDDKRFRRLSPRTVTKVNHKSSSQNFVNQEKISEETAYYVSSSTVIHHNTASTRLRSRYGLPPSTAYRNYDYEVNDIEVDLNYKPKKEYNWRKNFKIDDDGNQNSLVSNEERGLLEENEFTNSEINFNSDQEKEEKISYSEATKSEENYREIKSEATNRTEVISSETVHSKKLSYQFQEYEKGHVAAVETAEVVQTDLSSKKKKIKKKTRKGSKASIGDEDLSDIKNLDSIKNDDDQIDSSSKKKTNKKKKVKNEQENISSPNESLEIKQKLVTSESKKKSESKLNKNQNKSNFSHIKLIESNKNKVQESIISSNIEMLNRNTNFSRPNSPQQIFSRRQELPQQKSFNTANIVSSKKSISPEPNANSTSIRINSQPTNVQQKTIERQNSSGVYDLIKDGSMYPWF